MLDMKAVQDIATQWRQANQENPGGVVLIWQGAVYGWKDALRDVQHERPGAYAVDAAGAVFVADGGTDYDGAERWVAVPADDFLSGVLQPRTMQ